MIPTGQNICDQVRSILGDTQISSGQIFTNQYLYGANNSGAMQSAYSWLYERMITKADRRSRRTSFALINPNINYIVPATIGIGNLGYPIDIWERGTVSTFTITAATQTVASTGVDPYVLLTVTPAHSLVTGNIVETYLIQGLSDDVNDYWTVVIPDSTHIKLMGASPGGVYTNSTGLVIFSTEAWPGRPMKRSWNLFQEPTASQGSPAANSPANMFQNWQWQNGVIRVPPVTSPREIMVNYNLSGQIPVDPSVSLGIDECSNVLAYRVAGIAGKAKDKPAESCDSYLTLSDKFMNEFLQPSTKDLQRERIIVPPYRPARNTGYYNPY